MSWRRYTSLSSFLLALLFSVLYALPVSAADPAHCTGAQQLSLDLCFGYFNGKDYGQTGIWGGNVLGTYTGSSWAKDGFAIPMGVNSAADLENFVRGYLGTSCSTCGSCYNYNRAGAAFIVDASLGVNGPDGGNVCAGIRHAQADFGKWVKDVDYYDSQGWIQWNPPLKTISAGQINTMHVCVVAASSCPVNGNNIITANDGRDIAFYKIDAGDGGLPEQSHEIIFNTPTGLLRIRRECGNIVGFAHPITPPPTLTVSCASDDQPALPPDPTKGFNITVHISYSQAPAGIFPTYALYAKISGPEPGTTTIAQKSNNNPTISQNSDNSYDVSSTLNVPAINNSGTFDITWYATGPTNPDPNPACSDTITIANQPYFSVDGGDVSAGASMGAGGKECATNPDSFASIVGWNQENATYSGSGTQYAAFAMQYLQDFATAQGTAAPQVPSGLAFSNTDGKSIGGVGSDTYGGMIDSEPCVPDYFATHPAIANYTGPYTYRNQIDVATPGIYKTKYIDGDLTIDVDANIKDGSHTILYVKGNVYIDHDILYPNGSFTNGTQDVPSFTIIAQGNIYVDSSVSELDGWYIAQPDNANATDGIFYSCASGMGSPAPWGSAALNGACHNQLKVYGAVTARQIWLERTAGTLYNANRAERFYFTPETWLANPLGDNWGGSTYDSITIRPPAL